MPVHASAAAPSTLPTLPYDILALIIAHGPNSRPTLLAICLASRDLHTLATTELYRVLHFDWSDAPERIDILFQTLSSNRDLALRVTSLSLASRLPEPSLPKFVEALRHMLMLRHFYYVDIGKLVELCPDVLSVIAQLTQLRSMRISSWITSHADYWHKVLDCLPPMTAITIQVDHARISALERLLLRSVYTLESLILWGAYDIDAFLSSSAAGVVWGRLRALELYSMDEVSSARAFPHVERLCLAMPAPAIIADPAAFPLATQFTLCAGGAPFDAVEHLSLRRVRHLVVNVTLNSGPGVLSTVDYQAFLGTFHSATLYSLSLGLYDLPDLLNSETLVNILRNCTNLRYLGFQLTQNIFDLMDTCIDTFPKVPALANVRFFAACNPSRPAGNLESQFKELVAAEAATRALRLFEVLPGLQVFQFTPWSAVSSEHLVWRRKAADVVRVYDDSVELPLEPNDIADIADIA